MKQKVKNLGICAIITLFICITNVIAVDNLKITDVKTASYTTKENQMGDVGNARGFNTTIDGTNKSLILTTTSKFIETDIDEYDYDEDKQGYYRINYKAHYTSDGEKYNNFDLTNFVKEKYSCDNSEKCRIYFEKAFNKNNTFYMSGYIEKIEITKDEDGYNDYNHNYSPILIKTTDGKVYEKVNNLPSYNYDGTSVFLYNNTYILAGEKYIYKDEKYEYYTSTDLSNWVKHELDLTDFGYSKDEIEYFGELVKYDGISSWGVHFTAGYPEYVLYDFNDYNNATTIVTKNFNNYTLIDESEVTTANSKAYCDKDVNPELCNSDYPTQVNVYKTSGSFINENQTVGFKLAYKIPSGPIAGLYTKGWDLYIMRRNTNKFVPLIGKGDDSSLKWYYTWNDQENKIILFAKDYEKENSKTRIYHFNDYEKSLDYTEYSIEIDPNKFNDYSMSAKDNKFVILYDNEYLLITDLNLSKFTRMKIPKTKQISFSEDGETLSLVNENNIYTMTTDSIYNATKLEQINISDCTASLASSYNYTGSNIKPNFKVTYNDSLLENGKDYKVSYTSNKNVGTAKVVITGIGQYTGTLTKTFKIVVAQPKSLAVSKQDKSSITVKWSKPSGSITGYELYYSTKKDTGYKKVTTTTKTTYKKTGLSAGKVYYFKVRSYKTISGKKYYSSYTDVVSMSTSPATPTIKLSSNTSAVKVSWKKVSGATEYEVYQSTDKKKYTKVETTSDLSLMINNLSSAKTYYYKVRAIKYYDDKDIKGSYSKVVSTTTKPLAPNVSVSTNTNSATIKWNKVSGASGYEIYQSTNGKKYTKIKTITKGSTTSYKKTKLTTAKGYYYKVRAYKTVSGKKVYSSYTTVLAITAPTTPTSVKVKLNSLGVELNYKKVSGATAYEIYISTDNKTYTALTTTTSLKYTDTSSNAGEKTYYKVRSYKEINGVRKYSGYSKEVSIIKPIIGPQ